MTVWRGVLFLTHSVERDSGATVGKHWNHCGRKTQLLTSHQHHCQKKPMPEHHSLRCQAESCMPSVFIFWLSLWGIISKRVRRGAKQFRVEMLRTSSPIDRYSCDPCPLRGVTGRNQNAKKIFLVSDLYFVSRHSRLGLVLHVCILYLPSYKPFSAFRGERCSVSPIHIAMTT